MSVPERWAAAYQSALRQGPINLGPFYSPDATVDPRALGMPLVSDSGSTRREDLVRTIATVFPLITQDSQGTGTGTERLYVSAEGLVQSSDLLDRAASSPRHLVSLYRFARTGVDNQVLALAELSWRRSYAGDARILPVHRLAQEYVRAWSSRSPADVDSLYSADAAMTDSLLGMSASSASEIASMAAADPRDGGLPGVGLVSLPDFGGPAVFVAADPHRGSGPFRDVVILVQGQDGGGCPGSLAVVLHLDEQGLIAAEDRFHGVADLDRCVGPTDGTDSPGSAEPSGASRTPSPATPATWWEEVSIPSAVAKEQTGTVRIGDTDVPVFNATPGMADLVAWGAQRYASAGLAVPAVSEVSFYPPSIDLCAGVQGLAAGTVLSLCFDRPLTCANGDCTAWNPAARKILLHELAHTWMAANLERSTIDAFTEQSGLRSWADTADPWGQRAVELAAATMAWGLMDAPDAVSTQFGPRTCAELAALFQTLTGKPAPAAATCTG